AGAASSQNATVFQEALRRHTVSSVMDRDFGRVQAGVSVQHLAEDHLLERPTTLGRPPHAYAVYRDESLLGTVRMRQLGRPPVGVLPRWWSPLARAVDVSCRWWRPTRGLRGGG